MKLKTFRQLKAPKSQSISKNTYKVNGKRVEVKRIDNNDFIIKKENRSQKVHVNKKVVGKEKNGKIRVKYDVKIGSRKPITFTCDMKKPMDLPPVMIARVSEV